MTIGRVGRHSQINIEYQRPCQQRRREYYVSGRGVLGLTIGGSPKLP
jgi:hypothetical protein